VFAKDLGVINKVPALSRDLRSAPHFQTWYLYFQTAKSPFDDLRVRQAISHAIDRETITKVILQGHGTPAYTMLPPNFPGYTGDQLKSIQAYDVPQAKKLLADAGYPGGRRFPSTEFWLRQADPSHSGYAERIAQYKYANQKSGDRFVYEQYV